MASNFDSSIYRGSDLFFDFPCFTCLGNDRNTESEFYCEDCSKVYCGKCLEFIHNIHKHRYRQAKPNACCTVPSQNDHEDQISETNKQGLVSSPVSGTLRQADIANQTSVLNKPHSISSQILVTPKHGDIAQHTTAIHKQDHFSNPISNSSTQSSDVNKPGQMPGTVTSYTHQLVPEYQPSAISKSDPNQVIRVKSTGSKMYDVKFGRDSNLCWISGICETAAGELLISDRSNRKVKLLDKTYKVVEDSYLYGTPVSMCSIDSSLVAVAVNKNTFMEEILDRKSEVQFIRVTNGQLGWDGTLKLQHHCESIAHHQGNLYIISGNALLHYTVDGSLLSMMYYYFHTTCTALSCAVSPDGDRIYVANSTHGLVTLSREGTVISKLTDPVLMTRSMPLVVFYGDNPAGLHVTDSGQVLVCAANTDTIIQVDRDGRQRLAEVVPEKHFGRPPVSVFYSQQTGILIVGMKDNNNIMVFIKH